MPRLVQGGQHRRVEQSVAIAVTRHGVLDGFLHPRPDPLKRRAVGTGLEVPENRENDAAVAVNRAIPRNLAAIGQ